MMPLAMAANKKLDKQIIEIEVVLKPLL